MIKPQITRLIALLMVMPGLAAHAELIPITNFSFEDPVVGENLFTQGGHGNTTAIPGWIIATNAGHTFNGVFNPANDSFSNTSGTPGPSPEPETAPKSPILTLGSTARSPASPPPTLSPRLPPTCATR